MPYKFFGMYIKYSYFLTMLPNFVIMGLTGFIGLISYILKDKFNLVYIILNFAKENPFYFVMIFLLIQIFFLWFRY